MSGRKAVRTAAQPARTTQQVARDAVRIARPEDGERIAAIYAPYVTSTVITFEVDSPRADAMSERIEGVLGRWPWLVHDDSGTVAGYAYACEHRSRAAYRWSVDVAVYVDPAFHRRGVGRALYHALLRILEAQGFRNAYAGITLPNVASVGLHESLGFEPVGVYRRVGFKMGAWHDVGWWSKALAPHVSSPTEPVPFAEIRKAPATQALLRSIA